MAGSHIEVNLPFLFIITQMTLMTTVWDAGQRITTRRGGTSEGRWKRDEG